MARRRTAPVAFAAIVASLLLHGALLTILLSRPPPPWDRAHREVVELEVRHVVRSPPVQPTPTPTPEPRPTHRRAPAPRQQPAVAAPPEAAPLPEPTEPTAIDAPPADVPRAPDLRAASISITQRLEVPGAHEPSPGVQPPAQLADPNARTQALIVAEEGRAKVEGGRVDPYFTQVSRALAKGWSTHSKILDPSLEDLGTQFARNSKLGTQLWQKMAANFGSRGAPLDAPTDSPRDAAQTQQQAVNDYRRQMREAWRASKRVLVRLTQSPGGLVQAVELVQSSNDPDLDAEVLHELRGGAITLPVPPHEGLGIHDPIRSVWSFELVISISPPVPTLTGAFDEVTRTIDVRRPLDRRIYKYVQLISVD